MPEEDPLERLSSKELHDLAVSRAKRHLDVRFFWRLMQVLPAAEAAAGELEEAEADVARISAHIDDVTASSLPLDRRSDRVRKWWATRCSLDGPPAASGVPRGAARRQPLRGSTGQ